MMDKSQNQDSSIAVEEKITAIHLYEEDLKSVRKKMRFANINEIITFQRISQIHNKDLIDTNPTLFTQSNIKECNFKLVDTKSEQYLIIDGKKESIQDMILKEDKKWQMNINLTNIRKQSILHLQIDQIKRNQTFTIETYQTSQNKPIGFRFTFTKVQGSLALRVWVQLDQMHKIWKEMEVPILQNPIILEIHQLNNQESNVVINDFVFHLVLKMPFYQAAHYCLFHQGSVNISRIQFESKTQKKYFEDQQTNCTNQCKLI